jgi:two-component system NtrC family sensor kinase
VTDQSAQSTVDVLTGLTCALSAGLAVTRAQSPVLWAVAAALVAATAVAARVPLLIGVAGAAVCAGVSQLSPVLAPFAWLVYPALIAGAAAQLGWHRRARRRELALDITLLVCAATVAGLTLSYAVPPSPGASAGWTIFHRSLPILFLSLVALLLASRGSGIGRAGGVSLGVAVVSLSVGSEVSALRAPASGVAFIAFALAARWITRARASTSPAGGREITGSSAVRARFIIIATGVVSIATFVLGFRGESSPALAIAVALFVALLAARASRSLAAQTEQATLLARSVDAERALSSTLEQRIAERSGELANAERVLERMWMLGQHVALELDPTRVLERFLEAVMDVAHAEGGTVALVIDDAKYRIAAAAGFLSLFDGAIFANDSANGRVIQTGRTLATDDLTLHPGLISESVTKALPQMRSVIIVPLKRRGARIGSVALASSAVSAFSPDDISRVEAMSDMLSVALANADLVQDLRQAELRFRTLFRAAPDAVLTVQLGGRVAEANDYVRELVGSDPTDRDLMEVVAPKDQRRLREALTAAFGGLPARVEVDVVRPGGESRAVSMAARRLPETDPPTLLIIGRDMTGEREMRARLMETERLAAVGELVAGVAHEVNNPLSSISAFAQLLLRDEGLTPQQRESIDVIRSETGRASQVVRDLLAFARRSAPQREPLDLNQVVERTIRLRNYQLTSSGIRVLLDLSADIPAIHGDARQLQQVVLNLVTNAIQAMANIGGGTLSIATRGDRNTVVLDVADTGPGIPPDLRQRIFEPFFTTKPEGEGTGLGLSVSYGIVTAHGGTIALVDSASGARFVVEIPAINERAERHVSAEMPAYTARSPLAGMTVLFVDDEATLRHGFEAFGKLRGFGVVSASDAGAALHVVREGEPRVDIVVTDLRMPGVDGIGLYHSLVAERPGLAARTVFITGDVVSMSDRAVERPTLTKPFSFERLEETLVGVLSVAAGEDSVG